MGRALGRAGDALLLATALALLYAWQEAVQVAYMRRNYLVLANAIDLALIVQMALLAPMLLFADGTPAEADDDGGGVAALGALSALVILLKGARVARERAAFLVTMLQEIVVDMGAFLVFMGAVIAAAFSFAVLTRATDASFASSLFDAYGLLIFSTSPVTHELYLEPDYTVFVYGPLTLTVNIIMLNALIAIMGDTYDRVSGEHRARPAARRAARRVRCGDGRAPHRRPALPAGCTRSAARRTTRSPAARRTRRRGGPGA